MFLMYHKGCPISIVPLFLELELDFMLFKDEIMHFFHDIFYVLCPVETIFNPWRSRFHKRILQKNMYKKSWIFKITTWNRLFFLKKKYKKSRFFMNFWQNFTNFVFTIIPWGEKIKRKSGLWWGKTAFAFFQKRTFYKNL